LMRKTQLSVASKVCSLMSFPLYPQRSARYNGSIPHNRKDLLSMFRPTRRQASFFDTDSLCERLIPEDSFYRRFRQIVYPLIKDEDFRQMYCGDNGRPAISPSLLAMATILQFHRDLSDRQMERACTYDIEIKYALNLSIDERPFDHSSLHDFRKRLLVNGKEKEVFDRILAALIDNGLIETNEIQRIDATHVIADIAIPTMIALIKKGIFEVLKPLRKKHRHILSGISSDIDLAPYDRNEINHDHPGRMDMEKKKRVLVDVVKDARKVLDHVRDIDDPVIIEPAAMLRRILRENITEDNEGPQEMSYSGKPKDILVSPVDPDARYGAKSRSKRFTGYKANITETTKSRFVTSIQAIPGNRPDGDVTTVSVLEQQHHGLKPEKLIGDTAYSNGIHRRALRDLGTKVIAPLKIPNNTTRAVLPKSMFDHNEETMTLTCPAGVTTNPASYEKGRSIAVYHFPQAVCTRCPRNSECTVSSDRRRTVCISRFNKDLRDAEVYNRTDSFKEDMRLRPPIEGKLSEMVRYHGMRRARYRGLKKVHLQCYFTAAAVNIKRWIKLEIEKMKPKIGFVPA